MMSGILGLQVLLFAGEAFAASALIMAIAWLGAAGRTASQRHLVWAAGFGALLLLPLLAAFAPSLVHFSVATQTTTAAPAAMPVVGEPTATLIAAPAGPGSPDLIPVNGAPHQHALAFGAALLAKAALAIWLFGVLAVAARALFAGFALLRLKARSTPHRFGHMAIAGPECELRIADEAEGCGPVTWGLLRPVVLLPKDCVFWPRERLDAVLLHELAHVARRDCLVQMLALAVCALYWPNPLVWFGARRLRREAEIAADDAVIVSGIKPSTYASALLRIANDFQNRPLSHMPLAMAAPSALEQRVEAVLAPAQSRTGVTTMDVVRIAALGLIASATLAFARPSLAEDAHTALPAAKAARATPTPDAAVAPAASAAPGSSAPDVEVAPLAGDITPGAPSTDSPDNVAPSAPGTRVTHRESYAYVIESDDDGDGKVHVYKYRSMSPQDRAKIRAAMAKARAEMKAVRPQIELAVRQARDAVAAQRPKIELAVQQAHDAVEAAKPSIRLAIAAAKMSTASEVHRALAEARAEIAKQHLDAKTFAAVNRALDQAEAHMKNYDTFDVPVMPMVDESDDEEMPETPVAPVPPAPVK